VSDNCDLEITCSLQPTAEFGAVLPAWNPDKTKHGRYHGSMFPVEGCGKTKWVVGVYIDADVEQLLSEGLTENEIVAGCIRYLNKPPPRKKYARRQPRPLYGNLDDMPAQWRFAKKTFRNKQEKVYIQAMIVTDRKKNRLFWGEGVRV
jgi:hypothetical protein